MSERTNKISLFIADRNTGKTTYTKQVIAAQEKKVLIVDTLAHPMYDEFELVDIKRLQYWRSGTKRIITNLNRIKADAAYLSEHLRNTFIVFEDSTKYLRENTPASVFDLIYDSKQKNIDVYLIYHNFENTVKEILSNADYITLGQLTEDLSLYKKLPDRARILALQAHVNALCKKKKNNYQRLTIEI
jgi:hypothetical protein